MFSPYITAMVTWPVKIAREAKVNPKSFWNYVGEKFHPKSRLQQVRNPNGELSMSNEERATYLNTYFATVFTQEDGVSPSFPDIAQKLMPEIIIKEEDIFQLLRELKVDKAMGPDGLCPRILVEAKDDLVHPLKMLFCKSLNQGELPCDWKDAVVIPIFKKGKRDMPQNYRPVSLTCVVCKIMEKIVRNALVDHMVKNRLLSESQFGFVPGLSFALQLLVCMERWTKVLDDGGQVNVIYTDYSKAFDTVSHQKLLKKLHGLGVRGNTWIWIKSFLKDRRQKVKVEESFSDWVKVSSGVPQGSVLGPVLFLAYINDLPESIPGESVNHFADDTKLDKTITTSGDALTLQQSLSKMVEWSKKWSLNLNSSKCKVLHISRRPNPIEHILRRTWGCM